ncbi:MAG: LysR family transcriptional regulator [Clostridiales bacterium]|nr:LysR family transcriptional regulator [Clostridiales bacterium]
MTNLEIEAFLEIVRCGNISKAAESLFVTQPALSRRIRTLEGELGYSLFYRKRGIQSIELTQSGRLFIDLAQRYQSLWSDMQSLHNATPKALFRVSSIDSVGTYIFPEVYQSFAEHYPNIKLQLWDYDTNLAYNHMEAGLLDLAFSSDFRYSRKVKTLPAFAEPMCFLCSSQADYPSTVHPSMLEAESEVLVRWSPEYLTWHTRWFPSERRPKIFLEKMSLLEHFLSRERNWAIVPASAAAALKQKSQIQMRQLLDGPPKRTNRYIHIPGQKQEQVELFLSSLKDYLLTVTEYPLEIFL